MNWDTKSRYNERELHGYTTSYGLDKSHRSPPDQDAHSCMEADGPTGGRLRDVESLSMVADLTDDSEDGS